MRASLNRASGPHGQLELLQPTSARLLALLRDREKLLAKITRKKHVLSAEKASIHDLQRHLAQAQAQMQPLIEQNQGAQQEVHRLFAVLLGKGRLKRKDQGLVRQVYEELQNMGIIEPAPEAVDASDVFGWPPDDVEPGSAGRSHASPRGPDGAAAFKRPAGKSASSLRDIFRRLAIAVHPDRGQTDEERDHRTEAMKEVTRAYEDGDLARLLELEKAWLAVAEMPLDAADETERRCATLERINRELKRQLRELERELRELGHCAPVLAADQLGLRGKGAAGRVETLIAGMQEELDQVCQVRDFVRAFVDGKLTLDEFLAGPTGGADESDEFEPDMDDLAAFLGDLLGPGARPRRRTTGRRPGRR